MHRSNTRTRALRIVAAALFATFAVVTASCASQPGVQNPAPTQVTQQNSK